jgi:hypothetical protein
LISNELKIICKALRDIYTPMGYRGEGYLKNRDQGLGNREQGLGNRKQGTGKAHGGGDRSGGGWT